MTMPHPTAPPAVVPHTNTLAIIGFVGAFMIPVVGIVLGIMAQRQIAVNHEEGGTLAKAAVIVGVVGTALLVVFFIVWFAMLFFILGQTPNAPRT